MTGVTVSAVKWKSPYSVILDFTYTSNNFFLNSRSFKKKRKREEAPTSFGKYNSGEISILQGKTIG